MVAGSQSLFAEDERTDKSAFQEESEHAFHGQCLSDHAARILGKPRPVGAELKLHRNSGNNTYGKIESENLCPESNGFIIPFISSSQRTPFPIDQKPCQAHGELREEIMIGDGKSELQSTPKGGIGKDRVHLLLAPSVLSCRLRFLRLLRKAYFAVAGSFVLVKSGGRFSRNAVNASSASADRTRAENSSFSRLTARSS